MPGGQNTDSAISQASLVVHSGHSLQGLVQALTPLHEENSVSRLEKPYGPLSHAGLLTLVLK